MFGRLRLHPVRLRPRDARYSRMVAGGMLDEIFGGASSYSAGKSNGLRMKDARRNVQ
jgi:hypothetical protein